MLSFYGNAPKGSNCIILNIIKLICQNGTVNGYDWFLAGERKCGFSKEALLDAGLEVRRLLSKLEKFYPDIYITVHMLLWESNDIRRYEDHTFYTDIEDGGTWDWEYKTTPYYSREDGWWHVKPVRVGSVAHKEV